MNRKKCESDIQEENEWDIWERVHLRVTSKETAVKAMVPDAVMSEGCK